MIDNENFIGAISKRIFSVAGEYREGVNGEYHCLVSDSCVSIKSTLEDIRVCGDVKDECTLYLDVSNPYHNKDIHVKRLVLEGIVPYFISRGHRLSFFECEWFPMSINYQKYRESQSLGLFMDQAVKTTWTYNKLALPLGFCKIHSISEEVRKVTVILM